MARELFLRQCKDPGKQGSFLRFGRHQKYFSDQKRWRSFRLNDSWGSGTAERWISAGGHSPPH